MTYRDDFIEPLPISGWCLVYRCAIDNDIKIMHSISTLAAAKGMGRPMRDAGHMPLATFHTGKKRNLTCTKAEQPAAAAQPERSIIEILERIEFLLMRNLTP